MEQSDQMALGPDSVSVRQRVCCWTLFKGRLTRLTLLSVCVNHGSALEAKTTFTLERGAKAAAEAGSNEIGMVVVFQVVCARGCDIRWGGGFKDLKESNKREGEGVGKQEKKDVSLAEVIFG